MTDSVPSADRAAPASTSLVAFRLYVAGGAPNSLEALSNLKRICEEYLPGNHQIEVIDVLQEPRRAVSAGVFVTPMLVKVSPGPARQLVGNLSDRATVVLALELKGG